MEKRRAKPRPSDSNSTSLLGQPHCTKDSTHLSPAVSMRMSNEPITSATPFQLIQPKSRDRSLKGAETRINTDMHRLPNGHSSSTIGRPATPPIRSPSAATSPFVNPTSALLQNLINEQRAHRAPRAASVDHTVDNNPSTPTPTRQQEELSSSSTEKQRKVNDALSAGLKQPREMGIREMDQYVSKMNKLNFDLKLEIFHRVQQAAALEKKVERMQELEHQLQEMEILEEELQELRSVEEDNKRLRESNEVLRLELDKRDQAVNEAVDLICQLETKVEALDTQHYAEGSSDTRPNTSDSFISTPETSPQAITPRSKIFLDVPDRTSSRKGTRSAISQNSISRTETPTAPASTRRLRRHPSFLEEENNSTSVLRKVYLTDVNKSHGGFSAISKTGTVCSGDDTQEPESPRLSILSECSYLNPSISPSGSFDPEIPSISSPTRENTETLSTRLKEYQTNGTESNRLSQIEQWIQPRSLFQERGPSQPNRPTRATKTVSDKQPALGAAFQAKFPSKHSNLDAPNMEENSARSGRFPPTPDTMSTTKADAKNWSNTSIIAERSRALGRPRSADYITTRPSTAGTVLSEDMEMWSDTAHRGPGIGDHYHLTSMLPSFNHSRRSSSNPLHSDNSNWKPSNGKHEYGLSTAATKSPPSLTPQDWLDAALPAPTSKSAISTHGTDRGINPNERPMMKPAIEKSPVQANESSTIEEPQFPPASDLRIRISSRGTHPVTDLQSPARRRISFRPPFFNRSPTTSCRQTSISNPIESDKKASTTNRRSRRLSAGARSMNLETSAGHGCSSEYCKNEIHNNSVNLGTRPLSQATFTSSISGTTRRPLTAESGDHKRRSSHGLLGWMRGVSGIGPSGKEPEPSTTPPATATTMTPSRTPQDIKSKKPVTMNGPKVASLGPSRPTSAFALRSPDSPSSPLSPNFASIPDDNSDRRSRFSYRRVRKA